MRRKKLNMPGGRFALACLFCAALTVGLVLPAAEAQTKNMVNGNGRFAPNQNLCATLMVNGTPSGNCNEVCPTLSVAVCINPTTGAYSVSPNDGAHTGGGATQTGSVTVPGLPNPLTGAPSAVPNHTTDPNGNMSGTSNGRETSKSMISTAIAILVNLLQNPQAAMNVTGSYDVVVTWTTECEPEGECEYSVTITVGLDNSGTPTSASATGS